MDVGEHCYVAQCNQVDFLPFTCDCCDKVYCLEHRSYDAHECPSAGSKDRRVIKCPVCGDHFHWTSDQDVNEVWEAHARSNQCTNERLQAMRAAKKKKKKARCAADRCREVLLSSNTYHCTACNQDVCLKHRFEDDHNCQEVRKNRRQTATARFNAPAAAPRFNSAQLQRDAKQAAATVVSGTTSVVNAAMTNARAAATAASNAASELVTTSSEECPQCGVKFAYVSQLVAHFNRAHPEPRTRAPSSLPQAPAAAQQVASTAGGREVCPQCRAVFDNVEALIQHAESAHMGGSRSQVTAGNPSARDGDGKCLLM
ncbi:TPA: hypothetical protein N0F65_012157 [Lagenidium giganteum]|uniref:Zinc finger AN1 and C2H2 domain-containing stress-associated protein 16 n=1 Tax=Lagenidium giganteum TaxID=4803 RepID=A0AAV2YX89_9STRA|nr:TPA: hypothetical protein N0F65_012157 [Lagenidium giganteum]